MKIGIFSPTYPGVSEEGGIGTYTRGLAESLIGMGHEVRAITTGTQASEIKESGVPIEVIARGYKPILDRIIPGTSSTLRIGQRALNVTSKHRLQIFEFPNWEGRGLWFALRRSIPLVVRLHTSSAETQEIDNLPKTWEMQCDILREIWQARCADALVTHSEAHRRKMAEELRIDASQIEVIPHGITIYPDFKRPQVRRPNYRIVYVGRLEKRKGTLDLLKAVPLVLKEVPNTEFILIGRDRPHCPGGKTHREYVQSEFPPEYQHKIVFAGMLNDREVTHYLQSADLFVAPSLYESFGLVFIEAMRWGTAVVGTTAGGIPEIVRDSDSGVLVSPGSCTELAAAITFLLRNPERRRSLGESGRRRVETHFSARAIAAMTLEFYKQVVQEYEVHRS